MNKSELIDAMASGAGISKAAAKKAADVVRTRLKEREAMLLDIEIPCSIELRDRRAWAPDGRSVSLEEKLTEKYLKRNMLKH